MQQQVYVMAQPVEVRKFYGDEDRERIDRFVKEVERAWESQATAARKLDFLDQHVGVEVRQEIACMEPEVRESPEAVLKELKRIYGENRSPSTLLQAMLTVRQREGESTRKYSGRLKSAYDTLTKRQEALSTDVTTASILRDHFMAGLINKNLQSYLREKLIEQPEMNFVKVREIAIRWDPEVSNVEASLAYVAAPAPPAASASPAPPAADFENLQAQILELKDLVLKLSVQQPTHSPRSNRRNDGFISAGQAVCFRCRSTEHRMRDCPTAGNATPQML